MGRVKCMYIHPYIFYVHKTQLQSCVIQLLVVFFHCLFGILLRRNAAQEESPSKPRSEPQQDKPPPTLDPTPSLPRPRSRHQLDVDDHQGHRRSAQKPQAKGGRKSSLRMPSPAPQHPSAGRSVHVSLPANTRHTHLHICHVCSMHTCVHVYETFLTFYSSEVETPASKPSGPVK